MRLRAPRTALLSASLSLALAAGLPGSLRADGAGAEAVEGPEGAEAAAEGLRSALPPELTSLFPVGRVFKGVAIPSYNGDRIKTVMRAGSVTRLDERHLELEDLVVEIYDRGGDPGTSISMGLAHYDLFTGQLVSKTESRIEQPRFTMTGDTMTFETQSQIARLEGNVRVVIPDVASLAPNIALPGLTRRARERSQ